MKDKNRLQKMSFTAICAAIIIICTWITIPMPSGVPITLQTFAIAFCGFFLGSKYAPITVIVYLMIGAVGLPVFSGFSAGAGVLFGPTGGFLWGFIVMSIICGLSANVKSKLLCVLFSAIGLALCHLMGVIQFSVVTKQPLLSAFLMVSLPFLLKDGISLVIAFVVAKSLKKIKFIA